MNRMVLLLGFMMLIAFKEIYGWHIIMPGTKWCGNGNIAENDHDLGSYKETDKCCRTHDHCDSITVGSSKHGLTNDGQYSRLHCICDKEFYDCLRKSNDGLGATVGVAYFNVLNEKCYAFEHPATCIEYEHEWNEVRCAKYSYNTSLPAKWQWFEMRRFK